MVIRHLMYTCVRNLVLHCTLYYVYPGSNNNLISTLYMYILIQKEYKVFK